MSVDFYTYRGERLENLQTLGRVDSFKDVFHVAVNQLNLKWLPDVVGRAGLHIDRNNLAEVKREIDVLDHHAQALGNERHRRFLAAVVREMRSAVERLSLDDALTGYVG